MRVLYVSAAAFPGKAATGRCMHMIARSLVEAGHEVTVIAARWGEEPARDTIDRITVHRGGPARATTAAGAAGGLGGIWGLGAEMWRQSRHGAYDWAILYSLPIYYVLPTWPARHRMRIAAQFGDIRTSALLRGHMKRIAYSLGDMASARSAELLFNSGSSRLEDHLRQISPSSEVIRVVPPVDTQIFGTTESGSSRARWNIPADAKVVAYAGSMRTDEGVGDLVNAWAALQANGVSPRLLVVGGNLEQRALLRRQSVARGADEANLILTGELDLQGVASALDAADVLVLPKRDDIINHYAMPIKLGEFLATGRPVVCSRVGGCADVLTHDENALLYEPGNVEELRDRIGALLGDPDYAARIGRAGRRMAEQVFDRRVVGRQVIAALERPVGRRANVGRGPRRANLSM